MDVKRHGRLLASTSELRNCVKVKVEVDVLGSPSLIVHTVCGHEVYQSSGAA